MFSYCNNNPVLFQDPDGYCREVGALLTRIDCGSITCVTSVAFRSYANSVNYVDSYAAYVANSLAIFILDWYYGTPGYGDFNGTLTVGVSGGKTDVTNGSISAGICIDGQGNIGRVVSPTVGFGTPSSGSTIFFSITDAPSIQDLAGSSVQVGGSALYIGCERCTFEGAESQKNHTGSTIYIDPIGIISAVLGKGKVPTPEIHLTGSASFVSVWDNVRK